MRLPSANALFRVQATDDGGALLETSALQQPALQQPALLQRTLSSSIHTCIGSVGACRRSEASGPDAGLGASRAR